MLTCADCTLCSCKTNNLENLPQNCPTKQTSVQEIKNMYSDQEAKQSACSAILEKEGYCRLTRVEETILYAKRMGYKKIGVAFCTGLHQETKIFVKILRNNGFEVESIMCKNGSVDKCELGLKDEQKLHPGEFEAMCNPIGQAYFLNKAKTDFNVVIGLCVGHDTLFLKHIEGPTTVMIVKDRVMAHNPVGALYSYHHYCRRLDNVIKDNK